MMNRCSRLVSTVLLSFLFVFALQGQLNFRIDYQQFKDKSLGVTTSIESDQDGFVWVSTGQGLMRFDGTHFVHVNDLISDFPDVGSGIQELYLDSKNRLWIFKSTFGLACIELYDFTWRYFPEFNRNQVTSYYYSMHEDEAHGLFVPHQRGIARYNEELDTFSVIPLDDPGSGVRFITGANDILLFSTRRRVFRYDLDQNEISEFGNLRIEEGIVADLCLDEQGYLWISNWYSDDNGLLRYDITTERVVGIFGPTVSTSHYLSNTDIWEILPQGDGVLFASNSGGLWKYDFGEQETYKIERSGGLLVNSTDQIRSIHVDRFGRLWYGGSLDVHYQIQAAKEISLIGTHSQPPLPSNNIFTVAALEDGTIGVGSDRGLTIYDRSGGNAKNRQFPLYNGNEYNNHVNHIFEYEDHLWVGTWSSLRKLDPQTLKTVEHYITFSNAGRDHPEELMKFEIGAVMKTKIGRYGNLWIMNSAGALIKFSGSAGERLAQRYSFHGSEEECIDITRQDEQGILVLTSEALYKVDEDGGKLIEIQVKPDLINLESREIHWADDDVYLVTSDGLMYGSYSGDTLVLNSMKAGHYRELNHMTFENKNTAWLTEQRGLVRWDLSQDKSVLVDSELSLYSSSINRLINVEKLALTNDGALTLASNAGVVVVDVNRFTLDTSAPQLVFTGLRANGVSATNAPVHLLKQISLSHDQNNLQIEVSVLNSSEPASTSYWYRLAEDQEWLSNSNQTVLSLSGLAPGAYQLSVDATTGDGVAARSPITLDIAIRPPWYRTFLAWLLYLLIAAMIIYYIYRFRVTTMLARQEALRVKELDQFKNQFFTNITHEFRTPLTVIQGMADKIAQAPQKWSDRGARLIDRNSKTLLNLINQILELSKLEQGILSAELVRSDVVVFIRQIVGSLQSLAESNGQSLIFETQSPSIEMDFDKGHLRKIVTNLISNAIKYSDDAGTITVVLTEVVSRNQPIFEMRVKDEGVGIQEEQISRIFDRFHRVDHNTDQVGTGVGLAITRELIIAANGNIHVESRVGVGSTFIVQLPITQKAPLVAGDDFQVKAKETPEQNHINSNHDLSILLVEDNEDIAEYIMSILDTKYEVHFSRNGKEGLEKAIELMPDLVVSDLMMPVMDGVTMVRQIRQDARIDHLPVVLLTAKVGVENRIKGLREGADAYLAKPFREEELLVVIEGLLQQRERYRSKYAATSGSEPLGQTFDRNARYIDELKTIISDHIQDATFGVSELARECHLSTRQLTRKLSAISDHRPGQLIKEIRIDKAKELLLTTDKSVTEISFDVGFNSAQYFATVFKKEVGVSPGEYSVGEGGI